MKTLDRKEQFLRIKHDSKQAKAGLFFFDFTDNGFIVRHIPSLKLSCYGENPQEVEEMMNVVLDDFFENLMAMSENQIVTTLHELGWKQNTYFKKQFTGSSYIDTDGILRDLDLPESTVINKSFMEMAK